MINRTRLFECCIFFIDTIYVQFGGVEFQQLIDAIPLLADVLLHAHKAEFFLELLKNRD